MRFLASFCLVLLLLGCNAEPGDPGLVELSKLETFEWTGGQPISFSPPPPDWKRSRYQNGGAEGVDFVLPGSRGEQIYLAERFYLGRRDHCERLQTMLAELENYDRQGFREAINDIVFHEKKPLNEGERKAAKLGNAAIGRAQVAFGDESRLFTQIELKVAYEQARKIRYSIDDAVGRVLFTAEGNSVYPSLVVDQPRRGQVAGREAVMVHFTFMAHGEPFLGRRVYVVANNRLFEFSYQGREPNLVLFERVLETIEFPPGPCRH